MCQQKTKPPKRVRHHINPLAVQDEHHFQGFGNTRPLIVEIGAFKGIFAQQLLAARPDANFILCELRLPLADYLTTHFASHPNVTVFPGDAGRNFRSLVEPSLQNGAPLEEVFINFPDPWFKAKHHKRRFINPDFLQSLESWIPPTTQFIFQTDDPQLWQDTLEVISRRPGWQSTPFHESPYGATTQWERAKLKEGIPIHRLRFSYTLGQNSL